MQVSELAKLAATQKQIPSGKLINNVINLDEVNNDMFDGSFEAIYKAVKAEIIKPLAINGQIVGISYNGGYSSIEEDNKASYAFEKAYRCKPVQKYCLLAMQLVTAGLNPDKVVENEYDVYVYLLGNGVIINSNGDIIIEVDRDKYKYREDIEEILDEYLDKYLDDMFSDDYDYYNEDEDEDDYDDCDDDEDCCECDGKCESCSCMHKEEDDELPTQVVIPKLILVEVNEKSIRKYLREMYDHYLSADMKELDYEVNDRYVTVKNIKWGRKK